MNITANEILFLNRKNNLKFGENTTEPNAPESETPALDPKAVMNAMSIQGQNNMAFQGGKLNLLKLGKATVVGAGALLASVPMTSCIQEQNQEVVIEDRDEILAIYQSLQTFFQQMLEQGRISQELFNSFFTQWQSYFALVTQGIDNADAFYQAMYNWMTNDDTFKQFIMDQMVAQGHTMEEVRDILANIEARLAAGEITAQQAFQQLMALLGHIDTTLSQIAGDVAAIRNYQANINEGVDSCAARLSRIENNTRIVADNVPNMANDINIIKQNIQQQTGDIRDIKLNLQDTSLHPTYNDFNNWFNQLGLNINDAADTTVATLRDYLGNKLDSILAQNINQTNLLTSIDNKLDVLQYFPNLNDVNNNRDSVINAIVSLRTAINNLQPGQTIDYTPYFTALVNGLNGLNNKMNTLISETQTHTAAANTFFSNFNTHAANMHTFMLDAQTARTNTNAYLSNIRTYLNYIRGDVNSINNTNLRIENKIDTFSVASQNVPNDTTSDMSLSEFASFLYNTFGPNMFAQWTNWMSLNGFTSMPADLTRLNQLADSINHKADNLDTLVNQMNTVISLLGRANWTLILQTPGLLEDIIDILNSFDFCGCDEGNHGNNEGVDDLSELLNGLNNPSNLAKTRAKINKEYPHVTAAQLNAAHAEAKKLSK